MDQKTIVGWIESTQTYLGIELGSTRIKAVLIGDDYKPIASGGYEWSNAYEDGVWTYSLDDVWHGIGECYAQLSNDIKVKYGIELKKVGAIGVSAMMHGYMVFDNQWNQLVPFRTWRNNITSEASEALSQLFKYPIPQRWSIAHLYQAMLNKEKHTHDIAHMTTLAGYVHYKLTGKNVIGIGEASGMFPIDSTKNVYNESMLAQFNQLSLKQGYSWQLEKLLPQVMIAGDQAGYLTEEGAGLLDKKGVLEAGIPMCPPEGDAGTGMVATNSVAKRTGNVSAGTSVFAMIVLEHALSKVYSEIDLVTTPSGDLVAMAHSNNCSSDLDAWIKLFGEAATLLGATFDNDQLYQSMFKKALEGETDGGGLLSYGYLSGEHITHFEDGRPLFARTVDSQFNLANVMRTHLMSALGALKIGVDLLLVEEGVQVDKIFGHGGYFKTKGVGQRMMAAATNTPVAVMATAGEGGPYGMALLASFMMKHDQAEVLEDYLNNKVFKEAECVMVEPDEAAVEGFNAFMERYKKGLSIEKEAVSSLN